MSNALPPPDPLSDRWTGTVRAIRRWLHWVVPLVLVVLLLLYLGTAVTTVRAGQVGLLRQFGRIVGDPLPAGLHVHLPWPFQKVEKVDVQRSMRLECGFVERQATAAPNQPADSGVPWTRPATFCLTGDKNIIFARVVVHYRIKDPAQYLDKMLGAEQVLQATVDTTLLRVVSRLPVDSVLAAAKGGLSRDIHRQAQARLDRVGCPLAITSVELTQVEPPRAVRGAFRDVISAQLEMHTAVNRAEDKRMRLLRAATSTAKRIRSRADSYRYARLRDAEAAADGLKATVASLKAAGPIAKVRLLLDAMEKVMPLLRVYVLPAQGAERTKVFITPSRRPDAAEERAR